MTTTETEAKFRGAARAFAAPFSRSSACPAGEGAARGIALQLTRTAHERGKQLNGLRSPSNGKVDVRILSHKRRFRVKRNSETNHNRRKESRVMIAEL